MTAIPPESSLIPTAQAIKALAAEVDRDPEDLVNKITLASVLEQAGRVAEARVLYQEVIDQDSEGVCSAVARRALERIGNSNSLIALEPLEPLEKEVDSASKQPFRKFQRTSFWHKRGWRSLSFRSKIIIFFLASTALPLILGTQLLTTAMRTVVSQDAKESLAKIEDRLASQEIYIYGFLGSLLLLVYLIAIPVINSFARPLKQLASFAQAVESGQEVRLKSTYLQQQDEVGIISRSLNAIAANNEATLKALHQQEDRQWQENERLQREVINLLLDTQKVIDSNFTINLTARVEVNRGITGSIADAFNVLISSLQTVVLQVKIAASQVCEASGSSQVSMSALAQLNTKQSDVLLKAQNYVEAVEASVRKVAEASQNVLLIAHQVFTFAIEGVQSMEQTAQSMKLLHRSIIETTGEVKFLAESSQEVSKIVSTISKISEKTDILACNAAIEARNAGESGDGFRQVADEVRRLALDVKQATQDIDQLVVPMQQGASGVLKAMESSNMQVAASTKMVTKTRQILLEVVDSSREVDRVLQSLSSETASHVQNSHEVFQIVQAGAEMAQIASLESAEVLSLLQELDAVARELQTSISKFHVD